MMNGKDVAGQNYSASPHSPERSFVSCFLSCSEKMAAWRFLKGGVCILLPVILLLRYSIERFDYDVWWQMALGRYYLTHHTLVMDHSVFPGRQRIPPGFTIPAWAVLFFIGFTI